MPIQIITHTGCDLSPEEAEALGVSIVFDLVSIGGVTYKNLLEISPCSFYEAMKTSSTLPSTSHPSVGDFYSAFKEATERGFEVFFLSITSKMSGSYMCACAARDRLLAEGCKFPITVYDTLQCSHGMALMVKEAVALKDHGLSSSEIALKLDAFQKKIGVYFVLDTLKYAKAGGRVGAIKALAADALGIKPLLSFENGVVRDVGIAGNLKDGLKKVLQRYKEEADKTKPVIFFHQAAKESLSDFLCVFQNEFLQVPYTEADVGPVIGVYTGPGGVGMAFIKS